MRQRFVVTICAVLVACMASQAKPVTLKKAAALANKMRNVEFRIHKKSRARAKSNAEPAYYVFTGGEKNGFVIVAGDDIAKPILGYSTSGTLNDDDSLPPNMQAWLDDIEQQILQARKLGVEQGAETARMWEAPTLGETVLELETATWSQDAPFNRQCPLENDNRCVTGCVPTAFAILMKYYEYPSQGRGTTESYVTKTSGITVPERNLEHTYNWNLMKSDYSTYSQEQANAVSELMADIGAAIQADYTANGTGGSFVHEGIFRHFGYNNGMARMKKDYNDEEWNDMLRAELDKSRPVIYRGAQEEEGGGHVFLLVGYTTQNYFLVNWGWKGRYNGAYALDAMTPGEHVYNSNQSAGFDCVPAPMLPCVATVDETYTAPSLKAAITLAATDGSTTLIRMLQDAPITKEVIGEQKDVVLDLNGCKLTVISSGFRNNGRFTIEDTKGTGKIVVEDGNYSIINNYGDLTVKGGEFLVVSDKEEGTDYRRCIWTGEGTKTIIEGGKFSSPFQTLCLKGDMTIEGGEFEMTDNGSVISDYNSTGLLTIHGGTFINSGEQPEGNDYRRCIWTDKDCSVEITGGVFTCNSSSQALCLRGNATISGGTIENKGKGIDCASNGNVTIMDCRMGGKRNVYAWSGASLKCYGGIYSNIVTTSYLPSGYFCTYNTDAVTSEKYPYMVGNTLGIETVPQQQVSQEGTCYKLDGTVCRDAKKGIVIMRKQNGKTVKQISYLRKK